MKANRILLVSLLKLLKSADMKRLFLLTAILAVLGLSSCEKAPSKAIVGTWEATTMEAKVENFTMTMDVAETGAVIQFKFNSDGTATAYIEEEGMGDSTPFEYEVTDDILTIYFEDVATDIPITIEKKTMTMEFSGEILEEEGMTVKLYFKKI